MRPTIKRHEVRLLREADHTQTDIARFTGVPLRSVQRIQSEPRPADFDDKAESKRRKNGRPSKVEEYRGFVRDLLAKEPDLMVLEVLRRARMHGYAGAKSQFYTMVNHERPPEKVRPLVRFEGLAGEFCQHDFGQIDVRFVDATKRRVRFFASRMKYSRHVEVTIVENEQVEALVRALVEHYDNIGGVPLVAVFDRPTTVAIDWKKDGTVTQWNTTFLQVIAELGVGAEVCWPSRPQEKGAVENLVGWVKGSFFKQRRFLDMTDLHEQLASWKHEANHVRACRATGEIPAERMKTEKQRLRPVRVTPETLVLRIPIQVGPTGYVTHDACMYSMPPEAIGITGTLYLGKNTVRIVAGRWEATHTRLREHGKKSTDPQHRQAMVSEVCGKRGRLYLKREQLLDLDPIVVEYLTEVVHRRPRTWRQDVEQLHERLVTYGDTNLVHAITKAHGERAFGHEYVTHILVEFGASAKEATT